MTTSLTPYEIDVLNGIAYHEMSTANSCKPQSIDDTGTFCWVEDFSKTLTASQVKGVIASLVKKGLVKIDEWDQGDTVVNFTPEGWQAWQTNDDNRAE